MAAFLGSAGEFSYCERDFALTMMDFVLKCDDFWCYKCAGILHPPQTTAAMQINF